MPRMFVESKGGVGFEREGRRGACRLLEKGPRGRVDSCRRHALNLFRQQLGSARTIHH
jgi:hypothetical protein